MMESDVNASIGTREIFDLVHLVRCFLIAKKCVTFFLYRRDGLECLV